MLFLSQSVACYFNILCVWNSVNRSSSGAKLTWHATTKQYCRYTTSVDIQKRNAKLYSHSRGFQARSKDQEILEEGGGRCHATTKQHCRYTTIARCTSRWAMARGHRLNTSIVLAAVHGLSGLFRAVSAVEPFTLSSPSHSVPVPNRPSRLRGR